MKTTPAGPVYFGALALISATTLVVLGLLLRPAERVRTADPQPRDRLFPAGLLATDNPHQSVLPPQPVGPAVDPDPDYQPNVAPAVRIVGLAPAPREKESPYAGTAIGAVIAANGWRVPASGQELYDALQKLGDFAQLPVPFSAVALDSGLSRPRVVIALRPTPRTPTDPLLEIPSDRPNLEGRLFLAANTESGGLHKNPWVKTIEFISWNSRRLKFDFGVIEGLDETPELKFLDGARCFSCHKNRGPILGAAPWSNTINNQVVRTASSPRFTFEWKGLRTVFGLPNPARHDTIDGLKLLAPSAAEVDDGVRLGADLLRNREIFRALNRTLVGKRAFVLLLVAIAEPGSLQANEAAAVAAIDNTDLSRFLHDAIMIGRTTPSSQLIDFSPSGSMGTLVRGSFVAGWGGPGERTPDFIQWGGDIDTVIQYDNARAHGEHGLTGVHVPSNPKAFVKPPQRIAFRASELANAVLLARTIGLTASDRQFLADSLTAAARVGNGPPVRTSLLAWQVFSGPSFADVLKGGELPDRDDFKDRFVSGLLRVLGDRGYAGGFGIGRERYTSTPRRDPNYLAASEVELVPTTACLRCHDIRGSSKSPVFSPIPPLAFDPFDKAGREAWLATADRSRKQAVLGRMLKRLATEADMPPADSAEYELFRGKDPASFDAVREFLEVELRKSRGF